MMNLIGFIFYTIYMVSCAVKPVWLISISNEPIR